MYSASFKEGVGWEDGSAARELLSQVDPSTQVEWITTPAPSDLMPFSGLVGDLHTHYLMHTHISKYIRLKKIKKSKQANKTVQP